MFADFTDPNTQAQYAQLAANTPSTPAAARAGPGAGQVGNTAAFLLSELAAGMTGEILYVDAGYSHAVSGMPTDGGEAGG